MILKGTQVSSFGCFVLRSSFSSVSFSKLPRCLNDYKLRAVYYLSLQSYARRKPCSREAKPRTSRLNEGISTLTDFTEKLWPITDGKRGHGKSLAPRVNSLL